MFLRTVYVYCFKLLFKDCILNKINDCDLRKNLLKFGQILEIELKILKVFNKILKVFKILIFKSLKKLLKFNKF